MATVRHRQAMETSGITLWRRIADDIEQSIADGAYRDTDRLAGEMELAQRFGVNRHTVRRALSELAERGVVRTEHGRGTYLAPTKLAYPIKDRTRFSEIVGGSGREAGGKLIAHAREPASADVAKRLGIASGADVIRLEILRSADRLPICIATSWVPASVMPDAARIYRAQPSITRMLAHFGIDDYRRDSTRISAVMANSADAQHLDLAPGRLLLLVESVDIVLAGTPIVTSRARFAADRVDLVIES